MGSLFLTEIIFIITAAFLGGFLARSAKLPPILGYITSGVIFGIIGKNFFESYSSLEALSQIGISLLLFTLGFEISLDALKKINKKIVLIGISQVVLTSIIFIPVFSLLGLRLEVAFLFSILLSFSSTAIVIKLLQEKGLLNDFPGDNVFIFLLIQDLLIIPIIFLLPFLFSAESFSIGATVQFLILAIKPLLIFIAILVVGKYFLSRILNILFRYPTHELTILATIFTAAVSIGLFTSVGLPQSIAAFLAGVLISEQGKNLAPLAEIRPFRDIFLVLFFVVTGMLVNFSYVLSNFWLILGLSILIVLAKFLLSYLLLRFSKYTPSSSVFIASYLANIGEFSIVIGQIALTAHFIRSDEYNLLLSIFIVSLFFIPFWLKYFRVFAIKLSEFKILKGFLGEESYLYKGFSKSDFEGHVVVCGYGRVGSEVGNLLEFGKIPHVVIDFNRKVVNELSGLNRFAIYGDPSDDEVLASSFIDRAKVLVVTVPDGFSQKRIISTALKINPNLIVLCRSHIEDDRYGLLNMGVNTIVVPELEAGLRIGSEVLDIFGSSASEMHDFVKKIRRQRLL